MKSIKRILATILMLVLVSTLVMGTFSVSAAAAVTCSDKLIVVDDDFASKTNGATVSATVAGTTYTGKMGSTAFATLSEAVTAVTSQGSIYVAAGVYTGSIALDKGVHIYGNMMDVNPNDSSDISKAAAARAVTGANESILQDMQFYFAAVEADEIVSNHVLTINGFAVAGDSCINLQNERYMNARITISNNVFDLINESAYTNIGISDDAFSAIQLGVEQNSSQIAAAATIQNNRIERIGYTGDGLASTNGIETYWIGEVKVDGNYIANTSGMAFSVGQLQNTTLVTNNYIYNAGKTQVYNNIGGLVEISGNTFDTVGANNANGQYAFGVYANATADNYANSWKLDANSVLIFENTFKNLGNAIFVQGRKRLAGEPANFAPVGSAFYDNVFIPAVIDDCNFITMQCSDGTYSPKVYNNYTGGLNPTEICQVLSSVVGATFEFGSYWLNEEMTDSSDLLAVKAITNTAGISFANAKIENAPHCTVAAVVPCALDEIKLGLEVAEGAYYELYADKECTQPLSDNTLSLVTGTNYAYAKVHYGKYSIVYTMMLTKKVAYSEPLEASEYVVSTEFAQYATGLTVYVEIAGEWRRAVTGLSAFYDLALALNTAQKGDTIYLTAGRYETSTIFNKGVTIKGPKAGIDPNNMESSEYIINDERSNIAEEAVFTNEMDIVKGADGLSFDGIQFDEKGYIYIRTVFVMDGLSFKNSIFSSTEATDSFIRRGRNDKNQNTIRNLQVYRCRFVSGGTNNIMRLPNVATAVFEENVFCNSDKNIYMGGTDGNSSDVMLFKNNVFYNLTKNNFFIIGDTGEANPRVKNSFTLDGNKFINCNFSTFMNINHWTTGNQLTIINNRFEGTTKCGFAVAAEGGHSGQTITVNENYCGNAFAILNNKTEVVADCARNYYANGPVDVITGKANYLPYYIDAEMTILSGDYQITNVIAPAGATVDAQNKTINYIATTAADELNFVFDVSSGATYAVYADAECTQMCNNNTVTLVGQKTTAYAKVTADDGLTSAVYTINITQPKSKKAEIKGMDIAGCTFMAQGADRYTCVLPNNYVTGPMIPVVSAGATVSVYAGDDTEMKTPINYYADIFYPANKVTYIIKVTSEDGSLSKSYNVTFTRNKNTSCELFGIDGGVKDAEISGITATVTYGYETDKIIPDLIVSGGATYTYFEDIGGNIRKTDENVLQVGENKIYVKVTSEDGQSSQMYTIIMVREDQSAEKEILTESFPTYATSELDFEEDVEGLLVGLKYIGGNRIYLVPNSFIESIEDALVVSEGATYEIFKGYDYDADAPIGGAISSNAEQKTIQLTGGDNVFYVRVSAKNGTKAIYEMVVQNEIKNTESEIISINGFALERDGNVINAVAANDVTQIDFFLSTNATAKVYADRKKSVVIPSEMTTYTVTDTQEEFTDCRLSNALKQVYTKLYIDVTSQSGVTKSYVVTLTQGARNAVFTDTEKHWAESYIAQAYDMGITNGVANPDGSLSFNPGSYATRQEVAIFICNLLGIDTASYSKVNLPYKDASTISSWAKNAVCAVTALGIFTGDGTNFNAKANISRQEFMIVIVRACALDTSKGKASAIASFKDKNTIAKWAKVYVQTAVAYGLVNGDDKGKINPTAPISRAEIAKIMVCGKDFAR